MQYFFVVKSMKKLIIKSYRNFPVLSDDYNDKSATEKEQLTSLSSHLDVVIPTNSIYFTQIKNIALSPTSNNEKKIFV